MTSTSSTPETPARASLADHLRHWAAVTPEATASMFVDYTRNQRGTAESLTWAALHRRVGAAAAWLREHTGTGDRVAILAPQGLDYVVGFLAAQRAGAIAVPLFPPDLPGHADRLAVTLADCRPAAILTGPGAAAKVGEFVSRTHTGAPPVVAEVAGLTVRRVVDRPIPPVRGEQIAYLQYTSGSTRTPAGVMISHANVLANARQTLAGYGVRPGDGTTTVSWLPLFHDMGLVLGVAAPLVAGCRSVLMDPVAFLERPARWLKLLSGNPNAVSAAPNFAYGYAAARVSERERDWLHLDAVKALINGAEPVWPATIEKFQRAFGECGLRPETHRPSYGLAEATVLVTVSPMGTAPRTTTFDRDALAAGRAIPPATPDAPVSTLVSCGVPVGQTVRVVDPRRGTPAPDGQVGEIWVTGPNVARGYWDNEPATTRSFRARLTGKETVGARENWLRTGDLGVLCDGELYVTGRRKDLVIVGGRNHYPQDIELTVEQAHTAVRAHHVVAFAVPAAEQDGLVVLAERARDLGPDGVNRDELAATVRAAISARHTVALHDFALLEPGQVPRTSSGKVARAAARSAYLSGAFDAVGARGGAAR